MIYNYIATCLFGLEGFLGEEIDTLGSKRSTVELLLRVIHPLLQDVMFF